MAINQNLVVSAFYRACRRPLYKKSASTYIGECPYCHEGDSAGRKRRFYYIPAKDLLYCHNCNATRNGLNFVVEQTGMSMSEVLREEDKHADTVEDIIKRTDAFKRSNPNSLPEDSINLFDPGQVKFYKENKVVKDAMVFIERRRLASAVNRPRALWISLTDLVHKNRVVFPFYNTANKIEFYQSRALYAADEENGKYLSKTNADKTVFNISLVSPDLESIFLQEGPIDAMFLRNSVALAGIHPTEEQLALLNEKFPLHELVYVLDNQWVDKTSYKHTKKLLEAQQKVFIWPQELKEYKDLNDICVRMTLDEIKPEFILKHTYQGMAGLMKFSQITAP
jgi:hypothetical protein